MSDPLQATDSHMLVVSLGGKTFHLTEPDGPMHASFERALDEIAHLAPTHRLLITHGNRAPLEMMAEHGGVTGGGAETVDVLAALSGGWQGYVVETELRKRCPGYEVVTLATEALVDPHDPGFAHPSLPIGATIDPATARRLESEKGWSFVPVSGGCRRLLAVLEPVEIVQLDAINALLDRGAIVVCGGGGAIPVVAGEGGEPRGVDGVVDCDRAALLLARGVSAGALLLLTDVASVERHHGSAISHPIRELTPEEIELEDFDAETIRPKLRAAQEFVQTTTGFAVIGEASEALAVLEGRAGTRIVHPRETPLDELDREFERLEERREQLADDSRTVEQLAQEAQHNLEEMP